MNGGGSLIEREGMQLIQQWNKSVTISNTISLAKFINSHYIIIPPVPSVN